MKKSLLFTAFLLGSSLSVVAADSRSPSPAAPAPANPAGSADVYPLKTCVVSDEPLGEGEPVVYTHREPGKPDRVVRFCCEGCIDDFKQDPAKYLAKLDAASKAKK